MAYRGLAAALMLGLFGCGQAQHPPPQAPSPEQSVVSAPQKSSSAPSGLARRLEALPDLGWQTLESRRFRFRVPLPDAANWRVLADERWFQLDHQQSRSLLRLRTWTAGPRVSRQECAEQVYLWNRTLRPESEPMLERPLNAPEGYDVMVGIYLTRPDADTQGARALAIGAALRRCYAGIYQTQAQVGAEEELAARLRLIVEGVFERVELVGLEEVAEEPFPIH